MQPFLLRRFGQVSARLHHQAANLGRRAARTRLVGDAATGLGTATVYAALLLLTVHHTIPTATAGTAALAIRTGQGALHMVVDAVNTATEHGLYLGDWHTFTRGEGVSGPYLNRRGTHPAPADWDAIRLTDVSYTYPGATTPVLHGLTLTIPRGRIIALVGENGSGKTTLANLLSGLFLPTTGTLTWGTTPTTDIAPDSLWQHTALIPQRAYPWPFTARENITLGVAQPDGDAAVHRAAAASGADEVITTLPDGLDTSLARSWWGGHDLSGGQWQRLACARAFHREQATLLIADEPTSAMDARAEARFFDRLRTLATPARTLILITHRLASVRLADHIYVLNHGHLIEDGTHHDLLAANGLYADLFRLQAHAYQQQ